MIIADEIKRTRYHSDQYYYLIEFAIPVLAEPLDEIAFKLLDKGIIRGIRVACESDNYSFSLRSRPDLILPSVHELLRYIQIDQMVSDDTLTSFFDTAYNDKFLYAVVNNDASIALGPMLTCSFVLQNL